MNLATGDTVSVNGSLFTDNQPRTFKVNMTFANQYPNLILLKTPDSVYLENTSHSDLYYQLFNSSIPIPRPERVLVMVVPTNQAGTYLEKLIGGRRRHRKTRKARRNRRRPSRRN